MVYFTIPQSFAREETGDELISPYIEFKYLKNNEDQRILSARIFTADALGEIPLPGLHVKFYTNMEEPELMGEAITDDKGIAGYIIPQSAELPVDEENNWWFYAEFEGNDKVEMAMEELTVMDVNLTMALSENEKDGKSVKLEAYTTVDGENIPVTDEVIYLFVPRMFSLLPVGEGYFEYGTALIEFPGDVPGDEEGNLTVIARFHDHWQFANVEKRAETSWGVPSTHEVAETHRELWTQIAPWWMIITLTILLTGVWGHYIFAIVSLFRISRAGKKIKTAEAN